VPSPEERAGVLDTIEADLADVELALARLDAGTYGACEACGAPLPDEVLVSAPTVRRCGACG
jgi:RNA polymerase-binding transcription factor DksA